MTPAIPNSCPGTSAALMGSSLDFDGRPTDWSAVAFGVEDQAEGLPLDQRIFCLATIVLLSTPCVYVGAAAAWLLGR